MANIKDFIKKIGNSAVSLEEQQQALAQVEKTIIEAKQKRTEAVGKNADMVIQALKTIEARLEAKLVELNNTPAKQGIQGPAGQDGKDGKDGKDGRDGISGKDGTDGKDGVDGKDGISVVDAKIDFDGSLVVYLSNGSEIDCGQILQPEVAKNIIISSGGSGTSQVVTDTLVSLQNQINTLTGIDGVLGDMAQQNANAVAITGGTATLTSVTTPTVQATNSAGLALKNSAGTTQISMGAGGGDNISLNSSTNINGTNAQIDISPTGTGHVHIKPTGVNSVEIAPTYVGEMDNIVIGATTPSTVNATTLSGQTGVLRGTGQNLVVRSEDFSNASWGKTSVTVTTNTTTAPDGTTTADTLAATSANSACFQGVTTSSVGLTYTFSVYLRADSATNISIAFYDTPSYNSTLVACAVTTSWQRFTVTRTLGSGSTGIQATIGGNSTFSTGESVYAWGAQVELGSTANTYIPTTTTAVYGTPTLSFSGVSTLGLESNGALFLQPAGTGAIQAQATTSTTAGGNVRGAYATDWQTLRGAASQVASGTASATLSGASNVANATYATIAGGNQNTCSGIYSFLGGGILNTTSGLYSVSGGGQSNTASGYYGFVGNGFTNSTTSNAAVTTQSGTMNATTAVTLSGSNANIKVGQYITGTSIANDTYVAAISGTALTLSKVASGSSTSTLSFFTPHGVVVGGGNNQATGSYSFIGGGGDAGTAANRNVASGDWSTVGGGQQNTASGIGSVVAGGGTFGSGGSGNTASGVGSAILGGWGNTASGTGASVISGNNNTSNASRTTVLGSLATARAINGIFAMQPCNSPISASGGINQTSILVLARQTTDATATALASDSSAAGTTNQVILPNNSAYLFKATVISAVTGGGNTSGWKLEGVIKRGANAASTTIVGLVTTTLLAQDAGAATWAIAATADTTNGGLRITFTGQASTTIRTVCKVETTEVTF